MRVRLLLTSALLASLVGTSLPSVEAATTPSLGLVRTKGRVVKLTRPSGVPVYLDLGVRLVATGAAFELRAKRSSYSSPIDVTQVDASNPSVVVRDLPRQRSP